MISYLHGLPDETWQEPNPEDPLSVVDRVFDMYSLIGGQGKMIISDPVLMTFSFALIWLLLCLNRATELPMQVELSLAYDCEESVSREVLLRYIHHNRDQNTRRINSMGRSPWSPFPQHLFLQIL